MCLAALGGPSGEQPRDHALKLGESADWLWRQCEAPDAERATLADAHRTAHAAEAFLALGKRLGVEPVVTEVDESSVFCEIVVPGAS